MLSLKPSINWLSLRCASEAHSASEWLQLYSFDCTGSSADATSEQDR
jgi:hypothetical protein